MSTIDYFAQKPQLLFNKHYAHPTPVGGVATLIVIGLTILTLSSFSQNFLYKKGPIISSSESNFLDLPVFDLDGENLNMAFFFLSNLEKYVMDPKLFKIEAFLARIYLKEDKSIGEDTLELKLEECTESHFPDDNNIKKSFASLGIAKSLCFKKKQEVKPRLAGIWGQERFERILIRYSRCVNKTDRLFI